MNTNPESPVGRQLPIVSGYGTLTEIGEGQHISSLSIGPIRDGKGVMVADAAVLFRGELDRTTNPLVAFLRQGQVELGDFILDRQTGHYVLTCFEPTQLFLDVQFKVGPAPEWLLFNTHS